MRAASPAARHIVMAKTAAARSLCIEGGGKKEIDKGREEGSVGKHVKIFEGIHKNNPCVNKQQCEKTTMN